MNPHGGSRSRQTSVAKGKTNIGSQPQILSTVWGSADCIQVDLVPDAFETGTILFAPINELWPRRFIPRLCFRGDTVFGRPQSANPTLIVTHAESADSTVASSVRSLLAGSDPGGNYDAA